MELDITFEASAWEKEIQSLQPDSTLAAARFLALLEDEPEEALEEAFSQLADKRITLDISSLPVMPLPAESAARLRQEALLASQGKLQSGLEENDPLRLYLEEIARTPASGDEILLAQELIAGNKEAAEKLTALKLSRVIELSREYTGKGVLLLDLIQEASLGLWQGILCYTGGDFHAHCDWWIRQYLARGVVMQARDSGLGQKLRQGMEDYRDVDQRLLSELGRNPTEEEIAEAMHISIEEAQVFAQMRKAANTRQKIDEALEEKAPTPEDGQAVENTAYFQSRQRIMELLSTLTEQEAQLLSLRFGLEGGLPLSPEETGKKLGLTPDEVVAKEAAALTKLRKEKI